MAQNTRSLIIHLFNIKTRATNTNLKSYVTYCNFLKFDIGRYTDWPGNHKNFANTEQICKWNWTLSLNIEDWCPPKFYTENQFPSQREHIPH